jgi:hypothetical protein
MPLDDSYASFITQARPSLPSLHVHGTTDVLVPEERSRALWEAFTAGTVQRYTHGGGHMTPTCSGEWKQTLIDFLDRVERGQAWN